MAGLLLALLLLGCGGVGGGPTPANARLWPACCLPCCCWATWLARSTCKLPAFLAPPCCRPVVEATLAALPGGRCRYTVRTTILFVTKPNGFIKAMIDKGGWEGG